MPIPIAVAETSVPSNACGRWQTEEDAIGVALIEAGDPAETAVVASPISQESANPVLDTANTPQSSAVQGSSVHSAEELQRVAVDALSAAKNQDTAADALADAEWMVTDSELRVQTDLSKTMLPMVINGEAEKLVKNALRDAGAGELKLVLLPGVKTAASPKEATGSEEWQRASKGAGASYCAAGATSVSGRDSERD